MRRATARAVRRPRPYADGRSLRVLGEVAARAAGELAEGEAVEGTAEIDETAQLGLRLYRDRPGQSRTRRPARFDHVVLGEAPVEAAVGLVDLERVVLTLVPGDEPLAHGHDPERQ